jgi:hypothetical protein
MDEKIMRIVKLLSQPILASKTEVIIGKKTQGQQGQAFSFKFSSSIQAISKQNQNIITNVKTGFCQINLRPLPHQQHF